MATVQVRYIVHDFEAVLPFYTEQLGFTLVMHPAPPFAILAENSSGKPVELFEPRRAEASLRQRSSSS